MLRSASLIFWDFDGVIKDSVSAKAEALERLFSSYGTPLAKKVRLHHEANGGMSRYEKMPLYLAWAGEAAGEKQVREFCDRFGALARQSVLDAPWVPGVREYLDANYARQDFALVTAAPLEECRQILETLDIARCFREVHGAPKPKTEAVADILRRWDCRPEKALVVGDSEADLAAAEANGVAFLLRRTAHNGSLQKRYAGPKFDHLAHE